jgi:hypothetical protein
MAAAANTLVIACGALAREIIALRQANGWSHMEVTCLPAELHNRPEKIPALVREKIQRFRPAYPHMFVAYADCGTGGLLDVVLREEGVERLSGAHCYEFYAGEAAFAQLVCHDFSGKFGRHKHQHPVPGVLRQQVAQQTGAHVRIDCNRAV